MNKSRNYDKKKTLYAGARASRELKRGNLDTFMGLLTGVASVASHHRILRTARETLARQETAKGFFE